jgi:RNA polymerase sigma factor (sigma-70 family)
MFFSPSEIRTLIHLATKRTGTPIHDEDLEQDVALRALEAFRRLHHVTHPRALLMKIVYDSVRDYWRRRKTWEELATVDERYISHMPPLESNLDLKRRIEILGRALDRLPAAKRKLLELFYVRDHSIAEIATLQGRSISAVKMDLTRSRKSLSRIFRELSSGRSRGIRKTHDK